MSENVSPQDLVESIREGCGSSNYRGVALATPNYNAYAT